MNTQQHGFNGSHEPVKYIRERITRKTKDIKIKKINRCKNIRDRLKMEDNIIDIVPNRYLQLD